MKEKRTEIILLHHDKPIYTIESIVEINELISVMMWSRSKESELTLITIPVKRSHKGLYWRKGSGERPKDHFWQINPDFIISMNEVELDLED